MRNFLIIPFFLALSGACAQLMPQQISIPMRDGQTLAADLYLPSDQGSWPVVLIQTPYNKNLFRLALPLNVGQNISASPYAFVVLDWRCFYGSIAACNATATSGEDGFDAVEWIAAQDWCTGKIGTWGPSALGNVQFNTAREQPPHLTCAVPIVASPNFKYSHYFPGGVVLHEYLETLGGLFGGAFALVAQNPYSNFLWEITENSTFYPDEIAIPMLHIGGWFDHNTEPVLEWFHAMREVSPAASEQWVLMGPWTHGGTGFSGVGTTIQGDLSFPEAQNMHNIFARAFFDHYLLDEHNEWEMTAPVTYFQMGENTWLESDVFPPAGMSENRTFYLRDDFSLSETNAGSETVFTFSYDPSDPSPTIGGKTLSDKIEQGPYDQSAVENRDDNLIFTSPVLEEGIAVKGQIRVQLHVSSDRPDTDIALRLTEVYPDGRSIALGQIIQRMRFRNGYTMADEEFMTPGETYETELAFDNIAHTFQAGNRIRLVITSSNYPWFNRNMNTGEEMYPNGNLDTLVQPVIAMNSVHIQGVNASRMILPAEKSSSVDASAENFIEIYPNPSNTVLHISGMQTGAEVTLIDAQGSIAGHWIAISDTHTISLDGMISGMFFVRVLDKESTAIRKIVVSQ